MLQVVLGQVTGDLGYAHDDGLDCDPVSNFVRLLLSLGDCLAESLVVKGHDVGDRAHFTNLLKDPAPLVALAIKF